MIKPGFKTTEFWMHLAGQLPSVAAVVLGGSNPITLALGAVCALVSAVHYSSQRQNLKLAALDAAVAAAQAAAEKLKQDPARP